jgi:hypothetical protein
VRGAAPARIRPNRGALPHTRETTVRSISAGVCARAR